MIKHRIRQYLTGVLILFSMPVFSQTSDDLAHHPSPYLAMHAQDPVDWYLWGESVLQQARMQDKLIFISVGYFSCHWCHVVRRESYSDVEVAAILNRHFLSVKVDRELRPELDHRLIEFVRKLQGSSGWPLNVFLTPDGYPVTGFTYLPKAEFTDVLLQLQQQWASRPDEIKLAAKTFFEESTGNKLDIELLGLTNAPTESLVSAFISQSMGAADTLQGGFGDIAKYPQNPRLRALLEMIEQRQAQHPEAVEFLKLSLNTMAGRNLMDHINGGFFRYTIDPDWQTPHYEKMLYDNAQMVLLYLQAERIWPDQGYREIAQLTLQFIESRMQHPSGGYVSSLSAIDINDLEGGGYLWSEEQLARQLGDQAFEYLRRTWQLERRDQTMGDFLAKPLVGIDAQGDPKRNSNIRRRLQSVEKPPMPIDDKRLASWNALMLQALVEAAEFDDLYREKAIQQYRYMSDAFIVDGQLVRFAGNGGLAEITFEDYAFVGSAFLQYGKRLQDKEAIEWAREFASQAYRYYLVDSVWQMNRRALIPSEPGLWVVQDKAITSPMTQWIETVLGLPKIDPMIRREAKEMLQRVTREMLDTPSYYGSLIALRNRIDP